MKHIQYRNNHKNLVIILHEIYGLNNHIADIAKQYHLVGFDVICPNMLSRDMPFMIDETEEAYQYFINEVGFDSYKQINSLISNVRNNYNKIILIGFSVGATLAFRCSDNRLLDGVIGYYGSRIRDYLTVTPYCSTLLIFAKEDSFSAYSIIPGLQEHSKVQIEIMDGTHGFMNPYSHHYNGLSRDKANIITEKFIHQIL